MGSECIDQYPTWMEAAGFVDIECKSFYWPSNEWMEDEHLRCLGRQTEGNMLAGLEGFSLALLTREMGFSKDEVKQFTDRVAQDLKNRHIHACFPGTVVFGRKPWPSERLGPQIVLT